MIFGFGNETVGELTIEPLSQDHVRTLADIHRETFDRPWSDGEFTALLNSAGVGGLCLRGPLKKGGRLAGFILTRAVADEMEILTLAVRPSWQTLGCGSKLLHATLSKAYSDRLSAVFLEVNEHNSPALAVYKKAGFKQVGARQGYYAQGSNNPSAALVMRRDL